MFSKNALIAVLIIMLFIPSANYAQDDSLKVSIDQVAKAEKIIGLEFTDAERDSMLEDLSYNLGLYEMIRTVSIENAISPALIFNPLPSGFKPDLFQQKFNYGPLGKVKRPGNLEELAFYSVRELGELIKTGKVTSTELTKLFLSRLKKFDPKLHCVITFTEELALKQAAIADSEIAAGHYKGPLHGIPYGAKDLLAVKEYKTTWGAMPYKDQMLDYDAAAIKMLEKAGAVLVAKLSMGALAWGDVWYADTTRNPWDIKQGSSGSSAGSASAVSAGLVPFAIGTETWGSIVSPSVLPGFDRHLAGSAAPARWL